MKPSLLLQSRKKEILAVFGKYPLICNPRVFGSVSRGDDTENSDIDLLVDAKTGTTLLDLGGLQEELQKLLGIKVDLLTPDDILAHFRDKVLTEAVAL